MEIKTVTDPERPGGKLVVRAVVKGGSEIAWPSVCARCLGHPDTAGGLGNLETEHTENFPMRRFATVLIPYCKACHDEEVKKMRGKALVKIGLVSIPLISAVVILFVCSSQSLWWLASVAVLLFGAPFAWKLVRGWANPDWYVKAVQIESNGSDTWFYFENSEYGRKFIKSNKM